MNAIARRTGELLEFVKFSHTIFALPFAVLATVLAIAVPLPGDGQLNWHVGQLFGILVCMVSARTAAMAFNRIVDRKYDAMNPRTQNRHLPAGTLQLRDAVLLTVGSSCLFVLGTLLFLPNPLPLCASLPVLFFLMGYSYAKRFTAGAHLWLGVALSLAPICAWVALRGEVVWSTPNDLLPPSVLAAALAFWVAGFDIIYACQDANFDRQTGLHSIPALLGVPGALKLAALLHGFTMLALIALPLLAPQLGLGWLYGIAITAIALLLIYEHSLVSERDLQRVGIAFFHVNAVISVVIMLAASIDCIWL